MGGRLGLGAEGFLRWPQCLARGLALGTELPDSRALDWLRPVLFRALLRPAAEGELHPAHYSFLVVQQCAMAGGVENVIDEVTERGTGKCALLRGDWA